MPGGESVTQGGTCTQQEELDQEEIKENRIVAVEYQRMKKQLCKSNPSLPERTTLRNRQRHEDIDATKHQKTHICHRSSMDTDTAWLEAELQHMELVDTID